MSEKTVLEEAAEAIFGPRQEAYGHPANNFALIAALATAAFGHVFTASDVAIFNILQKVARELHSPKRDNRVDIAGYAETLQMVVERDASKPEVYPDIIDGEGDAWKFHSTGSDGVARYVMRVGGAATHTADHIYAFYGRPHELVDGDGSKWSHVGDGKYTYNVGPHGELAAGTLVRKRPEWIYEHYGRPKAEAS